MVFKVLAVYSVYTVKMQLNIATQSIGKMCMQ